MEELKFKISSALKDIIGRDLITDDNIAIFELVKNAYDAYATRVDITFENIYSENSRIIIKDNGKGMSLDDIKNKWLFVAYSAKKEGTEDESFDYRDNIYQKRAFAGAKGIGRFSCDRLGKELLLESTKRERKSNTELIITDWRLFEQDLKDEFIDITVAHETKPKSSYGLDHGTVLEITNLRSDWSREKFLQLKRSLAKLINPNRDKSKHDFKIFLNVPEELEHDKQEDGYNERVNGEVQNLIFETLEIKTTVIESSISIDGKTITTKLKDGGTLIYNIEENNLFKSLKDSSITIFYLNQSAKLTFARRMGLSSKEYGHIFVFKNGFRVYPYGETGEDPFKVDVRKAQGYARNLGNREIIGQINIDSNDIDLKETTSRGDGFIKNTTYKELEDYFWQTLRRLEKYVVDVQKWGLSIEDLDENESNSFKERIIELISNLTGSSEIIDFDYGEQFIELIKEAQSESTEKVLSNLEKLALNEKDESLLEDVKKVRKDFQEIRTAKTEIEKSLKEEERKRIQVSEDLEQKETENLFLKSVKSQDFDEIISFLHHIRISSTLIDKKLKNLLFEIKKDELDATKIIQIVQGISLENKKVNSVARFATKANFKLYTSEKEIDIVNYIEEYVVNILGLDPDQEPKIHLNKNGIIFSMNLRPIEINILIDNLISNSRKANAKNIEIQFRTDEEGDLIMEFKDDGDGIDKKNYENIFELGYTTTGGSGIGLHHISNILSKINGKVYVDSVLKEGTIFTFKFKGSNGL